MPTLTITSLENDVSNTGSLVYAISQANSGLIDSIAVSSSLNGETFDFSTLISLNGTSEEQLTAINVDCGKVSGLSGSLSATGGKAYGLAGFGSQNDKALELASFTGSVTVTASGEAIGVLSRNTGNPATQTLNVAASTGTVTVESTGGNAYGLAADSSSGRSGQNTASLAFDSMGLDITVTATDTAYGLYSRAACSFTYYDTASRNKAIASMDTGGLTGTIRVTGAKAYGLYVAADVSLSRTASLTVGDITGELTVAGGDAYGMCSSHDITFGNLSTGAITVSATENAYGLYAGGNLTGGDYALDISGSGNVYGFYAVGDISVVTPISSALRLHGGDNGNLFGVYSENGKFSSEDYSGEFSLSANGSGSVTLVRAYELAVTDFSGSFAATAENGVATALEGSIGTVSGLTGSLSATGGKAYGLAGFGSQNGKALELASFTGSVTVTASGEAIGVLSRNTGNPATQTLNVAASTGMVTVESTGGNAYGLAADSSFGRSGQNTASLAFDSMGLDITVTATDTAYGLYSRAACSFTYYDTASHNKAIASMDMGGLTGTIRVTGAKAYGLYVAADVSLSRTASLTVGDITGELTVTATGGDGYGMYSSHNLTVGDFSSTSITVTATANAYGLYAGGDISVAAPSITTLHLSGGDDANVYGIYSENGTINLDDLTGELSLSTTGNGNVTLLHGKNLSINATADTFTVSAEDGEATIIESSGGTLSALTGTLSATGGSAYGVKSSPGTLSVENFTGVITATASTGEAAGFAGVYAGAATGGLSFTGLSGDITASSDGGDAYGILSRHGGSGGYSSAVSTIIADELSAHVTVTATGLAAGVYSRAAQSGYYTSASSEVSIGDVSGFITVTGGNSAYGVYSGAYDAGSRNATLTTGDITGTISVSASEGDAYGLYSSHGMTVGDISAETISVTASEGSVAGLYALGNLTVGRISSNAISLDGVTIQYGLYAGGNLTVEAIESDAFEFNGASDRYGLYAGGTLSIPAFDASMEISASGSAVAATFCSGTISIDSFTGSLSVSSESGGATALEAVNGGTLKEFEGTMTATGGSAYGVKSSSGTLSVNGFTGKITATASDGEAAGFASVNAGSSTGVLSFTGLSGDITVSSDGGDAYGIISRHGGSSSYGSGISTVTADGLSAHVTVTATGLAAGVYSQAVQSGYYTSGSSEVSLGDVSGFITVTGGNSAYGVYSGAFYAGSRNATLTVSDITGTISVTASGGDAYGLYSSHGMTVGDISAEAISVTGNTGSSAGLYAGGNMTVGNIVPGAISINGAGTQYGLYAGGNLTVGRISSGAFSLGNESTQYGLYAGGNLSIEALESEAFTFQGADNIYGLYAGGAFTIPTLDVPFEVSATDGAAMALHAGTIAVDSFTGNLSASSESGEAAALNAENGGTLKAFEGTITATGGSAYGVKSSSGTLSIEGFTGSVMVTASTGEAAGFTNVYSGGAGGAGGYSFTGFTGSITVTSDAGDAFGIFSSRTGRSYSYYQQAVSTVAVDGLAGNITVTAAGLAAGVYSRASQTGYNPSTATSDVSLGDVTGFITVTGGSSAFGIYSAAYDSHNNTSSLAIGDMTGTISVSVSDGDAYGLFSSGSIQTGVLSGVLSVSSENGDAWLVRANGNATIGGFAEGFSATVTAGSGKTATGFSAGGVLTIPVWDVSFEASVDGDCNATALYGGTVAIDSFTGSLAATSESGEATALNAENGGTLKDVEGTITASGGSAYGVKSSSATLTVEGFTGTVKATASTGEAAGFANVYEGGNGGTGGYSFTGFAGSITATSDVGDAFGILSRRTGRSYSYYQQAVSTVAADGLAGNITVTAKGLAAGVYSRASQTGYYPATASSDVSLGDVTGFITVTGGSAAYGIYSAAYDSHNNTSSLAIGDMMGTISVSASDGDAYGLFSSGSIQTGVLSGVLSVSSENGDAWLVRANGNATIGGFAEGFSATVTAGSGKTATGFSAGGVLTIPVWDVSFEVSAEGDSNATALYGGTVAIDSFTGNLSASSESGEAAALNAENGGTLKTFEGTITAIGGNAYGVKSSSGTMTVEGFTGSVKATASTAEAAGFANVYEGGNGGTGGYSFTGFAGNIAVTSDAGDAFGILSRRTGRSYNYYQQAVSTVVADGLAGNITVKAAGLAAGVYSRSSQTGYYPSTASSDVSLGDVTGFITVTGGSAAYGIYSAAYDSHNNSSSLAVGNMTGTISVSASDGPTYGLFSNGSLTITGNISGDVYVSSGNDVAAFLSGSKTMLRSGTKTIIVKEAVIDEETGEELSPEETVEQQLTMDVSGSIVVDGYSGAYAILASGDSNVSISGIVAAGSFQISSSEDKESLLENLKNMTRGESPLPSLESLGYAYADGWLNNGNFMATSSQDDLAIAEGALILGRIALGGGENNLTIDSGAKLYGDITADSLNLAFNLNTLQEDVPVITAQQAGALSSSNTEWTINIADGLQSGRYLLAKVEGGLDAEEMAEFSVTVNTTDENHEITFADRLDKIGFADINVTEDGEVEFIYSDTFWVIDHNLKDNLISTLNNGSITLRFGGIIDEAAFSLDMVTMTDANGNAVAFTNYTIDIDRLTLEYDPLTVEGTYTLEVSNKIKNTDGDGLDQNRNKVAGEADDGYRVQLAADVSRPYVTDVTLEADAAGSPAILKVYFSENVKPETLAGNVKLLAMNGMEMMPADMQLLDNCLELTIPDEAGDKFSLQILEGVTDLVGNALDSGEETGIYEWSSVVTGKPEHLVATVDQLSWSPVKNARQYVVDYSTDNFEHFVRVTVPTTSLDSFQMPSGSYQWRVQAVGSEEWAFGEEIVANAQESAPQLVESNENGIHDLFFASGSDIWNGNYDAQHVGIGEWNGTEEVVALNGKNQITDIFAGSDDASILLLTDDENGDALFIDDIYSAFPEGVDAQARIANINEIRAGAGDDIVDLTSQRFDYVGGDMTVHGGLGDDVIWANSGNNTLFGDAGNDRIVGASGNDVIVGGSGDDSLHGGGGDDIFAFGGDWGNDSVEQLADGKVTLWFEEGSLEKWDASTLTYQDGENSVKVSGVMAENVTLKFGDDGSEQYGKLLESSAFDEFSSEKIFEKRNDRGMLA